VEEVRKPKECEQLPIDARELGVHEPGSVGIHRGPDAGRATTKHHGT
jgi:hypothetical protein